MKYIDAERLKAEIERLIEESDFDESANLYSLLSFLSDLKSEKPVPADLEEAANEYAYRGMPDEMKPYVKPVGDEVIKNFIAGAKWQKQHDAELIEIAYNDGITIGMTKQKEQMLKEAVEGDIGMTLHDKRADLYVRSKGYLPESLGIKCNDKVRIIIVKEESHD